jgi:hypothetical protein
MAISRRFGVLAGAAVVLLVLAASDGRAQPFYSYYSRLGVVPGHHFYQSPGYVYVPPLAYRAPAFSPSYSTFPTITPGANFPTITVGAATARSPSSAPLAWASFPPSNALSTSNAVYAAYGLSGFWDTPLTSPASYAGYYPSFYTGSSLFANYDPSPDTGYYPYGVYDYSPGYYVSPLLYAP